LSVTAAFQDVNFSEENSDNSKGGKNNKESKKDKKASRWIWKLIHVPVQRKSRAAKDQLLESANLLLTRITLGSASFLE
jgi:hypothetical protein